MKRAILFLVVFMSGNISAQLESFMRFPMQDSSSYVYNSVILKAPNDELLFFFVESDSLFYSRSINSGVSWNERILLAETSDDISNPEWNKILGLVTSQSRILVLYRGQDSQRYIIYSDDNGLNWSVPQAFNITETSKIYELTELNDTTLYCLYANSDKLYSIVSNNNGESWSNRSILWSNNRGACLASIDDSTKILIESNDTSSVLVKYISYDGGTTWQNSPTTIDISSYYNRYDDKWLNLIKQNDTVLVLTYYGEYLADGIQRSDIFISKSYDNGETWSEPQILNRYVGLNRNPQTTLINGKIYLTFTTDRFNKIQAWYGIIDESSDSQAPPNIYKIFTDPILPLSDQDLVIKAKVIDDESVESVILSYRFNDESTYYSVEMVDDGQHGDEEPNDMVFGNVIDIQKDIDSIVCFITAKDNDLLTVISDKKTISFINNNMFDAYYLEVNNIKLPVRNDGVIADDLIGSSYQGTFEESNFLFSGGFALTGYHDEAYWSNGVLTSSRVADYIPGPVEEILDTNYYKIYVLSSSALPFGKSWQAWQYAVELGAKFYDGDGDGKYNPVDKNGNGYWDPNEDRPDLLGDVTAWCVFNDGVPSTERRYNNIAPQGIEIKQTVFAYSPETYPELSNVVFIRYIIENMGTVTNVMDSVYFSAWLDSDIGHYYNDLSGSDTTLNAGYTYDNGPDDGYGQNPPAFVVSILQGPVSYIPNQSFIDNNQNGIFDLGTDTPLDTAKNFMGVLLGEEIYPGAINQDMSSFVSYMKSHPTQGDPDLDVQLRNYMLGKRPDGSFINPCDWQYGNVFNMNCEDVNPIYMYSGDPVNQNGWINTDNNDYRMLVTTGPFTLEKGNPVEIIVAYVVGRGTDALNSITVAKDIAKDAIGFYTTNFQYVPVSVKEDKLSKIPTKFLLEQNYPNPFNPSTTIRYGIPFGKALEIKLVVYDILGREVETLVKQKQGAGNYEVTFDASKLSSGIYYYQLQAGDFIQTKKMILLK